MKVEIGQSRPCNKCNKTFTKRYRCQICCDKCNSENQRETGIKTVSTGITRGGNKRIGESI